MSERQTNTKESSSKPEKPGWRRKVGVVLAGTALVAAGAFGGAYLAAQQDKGGEQVAATTGHERVPFHQEMQCLDGVIAMQPKGTGGEMQIIYRPMVKEDDRGTLWVQSGDADFNEKEPVADFPLTNLNAIQSNAVILANQKQPVFPCTIEGVAKTGVEGFDDQVGLLLTTDSGKVGQTISTAAGLSPAEIADKTSTIGLELSSLADAQASLESEVIRINENFLDGKYGNALTTAQLQEALD